MCATVQTCTWNTLESFRCVGSTELVCRHRGLVPQFTKISTNALNVLTQLRVEKRWTDWHLGNKPWVKFRIYCFEYEQNGTLVNLKVTAYHNNHNTTSKTTQQNPTQQIQTNCNKTKCMPKSMQTKKEIKKNLLEIKRE